MAFEVPSTVGGAYTSLRIPIQLTNKTGKTCLTKSCCFIRVILCNSKVLCTFMTDFLNCALGKNIFVSVDTTITNSIYSAPNNKQTRISTQKHVVLISFVPMSLRPIRDKSNSILTVYHSLKHLTNTLLVSLEYVPCHTQNVIQLTAEIFSDHW